MYAEEIFRRELKRPTVFRREEKLSIDYVPEELPCRDAYLTKIASFLKTLILNPGGMVPKIVIVGPSGVGKTAIVKRLGAIISEKKKRNVQYVHINCRKKRTIHEILTNILKKFNPGFPKRGFNEAELLFILNNDVLERNDQYLLLCLDDADSFLLSHPSFLFSLTRMRDDWINARQRLALVVVVKTLQFLDHLDESSKSSFHPKIVSFSKYTAEEIAEILKKRVVEAFDDSTVLPSAIQLISDLASKNGDIRYALQLLWLAGKCADEASAIQITPDLVRKASADLDNHLKKEILQGLSEHHLLILLGLVRYLRNTEKERATRGECESRYISLCVEYGVKPYKSSNFWKYASELADLTEIVTTEVATIEGKRGRTTFFSLNVATSDLEPVIHNKLEVQLEVALQNQGVVNSARSS